MQKIDFVVLWVDGADEAWIEEKNRYYCNELNQNKSSAYRDWGLLPFWFRGVETFAPWVNKIHFVTCGHLPTWLNTEHPKLNVVKHSDFISPECLPTFSANSIELNIHKIKGLAEHFVYLNDDTFLTAPMEETDFFKKGLPCDTAVMSVTVPSVKNEIFTYILFNDLLLINSNFSKKTVFRNLSKWINPKYGKSLLKNLYYLPIGKFSGFENLHLPNAYLKSVWEEVWEKETDILEDTIHRRFRTKEDVNQYIFRYWQLVTGKFCPRKANVGKCFVIGKDSKAIEEAFANRRYKMVCLNDDPDEIADFETEKARMLALFTQLLPEKSGFEK